jgi:AraC-like DNA-binding protein
LRIIKQNTFGLTVHLGIPTGVLADYVESIFELNGRPSYKVHRLLPAGYSEVLFNLGDVLFANNSAKENAQICCRQFLVSGIKTGYFDVTAPGFMNCIGIRFKMGAMKKLFDISPSEFTDNDYDLDLLISRSKANNIYEMLAECKTIPERFNLLSRLLINIIIQYKCDNVPESIVKRILVRPGMSINLLEKETGYSRQYLHRVFKSSTGISIKKFQQINRVSSVLKSLNSKPGSLTELAYANGYFDQSHFIKDFKQLTGHSPADYLSSVRKFDADPYYF